MYPQTCANLRCILNAVMTFQPITIAQLYMIKLPAALGALMIDVLIFADNHQGNAGEDHHYCDDIEGLRTDV